jgi:hypothetical protein
VIPSAKYSFSASPLIFTNGGIITIESPTALSTGAGKALPAVIGATSRIASFRDGLDNVWVAGIVAEGPA